jgi:hypothetical protein
VRVLNAKNGKPDKHQPVGYVFNPGPVQKTKNWAEGLKYAKTKKGQAVIDVPSDTKEIERGTFGYYPCASTLYYDMSEISKTGVIADCPRAAKLHLKPVPGTVILVVSNPPWWQQGQD